MAFNKDEIGPDIRQQFLQDLLGVDPKDLKINQGHSNNSLIPDLSRAVSIIDSDLNIDTAKRKEIIDIFLSVSKKVPEKSSIVTEELKCEIYSHYKESNHILDKMITCSPALKKELRIDEKGKK